jgi:hypothetical protein
MDENIPITVLTEDKEEEVTLFNTSILFNDSVYPNSKVTTNELELDNDFGKNIDENCLSIIEEKDSDNDSNNKSIIDDSENDDEPQMQIQNIEKTFNLKEFSDNNYENITVLNTLENEENFSNLSNTKPSDIKIKENDLENELKYQTKLKTKLNNLYETNTNTMETRALNFNEIREDNSIYIAKINSLQKEVKELHEKQAEKFETKYSFSRNNKINIIETYIKKYNLKYEFKKEQLLELDDEQFNKIYYNIYNINESRKNSLIYYGICFFIVWVVEYVYKKVNVNSNKNLFQKFTFEIFHDNLSDSFVMFETEYFPTNDKLGNPIINIGKFLLYFCFINLLFENPPTNLKI